MPATGTGRRTLVPDVANALRDQTDQQSALLTELVYATAEAKEPMR